MSRTKGALDKLHVSGFKSIRDQTIELTQLNVLIGANGSGKSNFIGVFELLRALVEKRLQGYVSAQGGAEQLLFQGRKVTSEIELKTAFGRNGYECTLQPTAEDLLSFASESDYYQGESYSTPYTEFLGSGHSETKLFESSASRPTKTIADHIIAALSSWRVYHFHDTSRSARVKATSNLEDNRALRDDASNLAPFLYLLGRRHPDHYQSIVETIRLAAPFFADFRLEPSRLDPSKIRLEWNERDSDAYFNAHALSDGTLRFICLATLLLQPDLPSTILLDEPELGLHPYAIGLLADLLRSASSRTQVIVATQSVTLVDQFEADDLLIADRVGGASVFHRPSASELSDWLEEYSLGDLWQKNVFGGRPTR